MKPKKTVFGVGINDADYVVTKRKTIGYVNGKRKQKRVWECTYYQAWRAMLERCYYTKKHEHNPTYKGCTVSEDWHTFSAFKSWMEKQDWQGNQLDKDILFKGNKVYSAETCVFVSPLVNSFINDSGAARGDLPIGVYWNKERDKFQSQCSNPYTNKQEYLGRFTCEMEAHQTWRKRKLEWAKELAAIQTDPRVAKALVDRYAQPMEKTKQREFVI